jgi:hypothetical protein
MAQTIIRLYSSYEPALEAAQALKNQGFAGDQIGLLGRPPGTQAVPSSSELVNTIKSIGVSGPRAETYAEAVLNGGALLCVWPPYGRSLQATRIMDGFDPVSSDVPPTDQPHHQAEGWKLIDEPAPLSRLLNIPVLIRD